LSSAGSKLARLAAAWLALTALPTGLVAGAGPAKADIYHWVDDQGVVHLTDSPADRRFQRYIPSRGGSGRGIEAIPRSSSILGLGIASSQLDYAVYTPGADGISPKAYDRLIARMARRYEVPPALVKAVVKTESNFHRHAVSSKGAQGLMQLMPETSRDLGVADPFSPEENVWAGTRYLREMKDRFGDWRQALAAYNAGPTMVDQYGGVPPFPETQEYVERVLDYYRRYHGDFSR
jgi:hypothetical protein